MIRKGYYCKYRGKIYRCATRDTTVLLRSPDVEDFERNGFEKNPYFGQNKFYDVGKYIKVVPKKDVEWFCRIGNRGKYKGRRVGIIGETDTEYVITSGYVPEGEQLFTEANGFEQIDRYLFGSIGGLRTARKRKSQKALQPCGFRSVWKTKNSGQKCV